MTRSQRIYRASFLLLTPDAEFPDANEVPQKPGDPLLRNDRCPVCAKSRIYWNNGRAYAARLRLLDDGRRGAQLAVGSGHRSAAAGARGASYPTARPSRNGRDPGVQVTANDANTYITWL